MKIDLPVTIVFDCPNINTADGRVRSRFVSRVCTLRLDSDEYDGVQIFPAYPPVDNESDNADALVNLLTPDELKRIVARAHRYPYDYGVGTEEERTKAQEAADAARAEEGP